MRDRCEYLACLRRLLTLGYDLKTARRVAAWAVDDSQPAPGWTHKEPT